MGFFPITIFLGSLSTIVLFFSPSPRSHRHCALGQVAASMLARASQLKQAMAIALTMAWDGWCFIWQTYSNHQDNAQVLFKLEAVKDDDFTKPPCSRPVDICQANLEVSPI